MSSNAKGGRPEIVKNGTIDKNRRDFLKTAALVGGSALVTGVPLVSYFTAPALSKGTGKWVDFGPVEDLEPGSVSMLSYEFLIKDGWLVLPQRGIVWANTGEGDKLTVFSSVCTHLSCSVIWLEETQVFECPCHAGRFDVNGQPISGPPKKPLIVLEHKIEDDKLLALLTF
ncbi:MAG: Rieske 2Fe-2S domain-containing protein [Planctomycetota bacterium]|jgi:menaquinol-cytochrome c reductase iron-sulfur subunit